MERAPALRTVYFDQAREQLDPAGTLRQGLGAHGDTVIFRDRPIHVAGWAKRFLFDAGQLDRPISSLSGGEQARVLIARLMLQPADVLLLDEPTNDLDIPTLEVLEESLTEFPGALVLVTHDRYLLDRVSTAVLGLDGRGGAQLYADYWQWEAGQAAQPPRPRRQGTQRPRPDPPPPRRNSPTWKRASGSRWRPAFWKRSSELEAIHAEMQSPEVVCDGPRLHACYQKLQAAEAGVQALYARWAELEAKQQ